MIDKAHDAIQKRSVPWDDMRDRRVLGRVEAEINERVRTGGRGRVGLMALTVAAAAAVTLVFAWPTAEPESPAIAQAPVAKSSFSGPHDPGGDLVPNLLLSDGSTVQPGADADVLVMNDSDDLVELMHLKGHVSYDVEPRPERRFVVDAKGVEIHVIGTTFSVHVTADHVKVDVERGLVEVVSGMGTSRLGPGDAIQVSHERQPAAEPQDTGPVAATTKQEAVKSKRPAPSIDTLLERADSAKAGGAFADAASALRRVVRLYPKDPRTQSALFSLAKVERIRGRHAAAAAAFGKCWRRAPRGSLAEDARAEEAVSWADAGKNDRARAAAERYLERFPSGAYADRMRRILDRE